MKVLKGSLRETLYCWPCDSSKEGTGSKLVTSLACSSAEHTCSGAVQQAPCIKRSTVYRQDQVTYMSDRLGLHRVENPSSQDIAVSLHLYTVRDRDPFRDVLSLPWLCMVLYQGGSTDIHPASQRSQARLSYLRRSDWQEEPYQAGPLSQRVRRQDDVK